MTCVDVRGVLHGWAPHTDLPDDVVAHLDGCGACRGAFDARFPPVMPPAAVAADAHAVPPSPRRWTMVAALLAAALLVSVVPQVLPLGGGDLAFASAEPEFCPVEAWLPPECPV